MIPFGEKELNFWVQNFPGARVARYADAGHFISEEKPEELIRELSVIFKG